MFFSSREESILATVFCSIQHHSTHHMKNWNFSPIGAWILTNIQLMAVKSINVEYRLLISTVCAAPAPVNITSFWFTFIRFFESTPVIYKTFYHPANKSFKKYLYKIIIYTVYNNIYIIFGSTPIFFTVHKFTVKSLQCAAVNFHLHYKYVYSAIWPCS